jgi:hypothetical protein
MNDELMTASLRFIVHHSAFIVYFVSLCALWTRQRRQNFLNSSRSGVVFLFLVVT